MGERRKPLIPYRWRRAIAWWLWRLFSPEGHVPVAGEVVGYGFLRVEQMDKNVYWARLDLPNGDGIVMWFRSKREITLTTEYD